MSDQQARAQFDWLQERLRDPNFVGIATSSGDWLPATVLRCARNSKELMRLLRQKGFPLEPQFEKNVGKSEDNV